MTNLFLKNLKIIFFLRILVNKYILFVESLTHVLRVHVSMTLILLYETNHYIITYASDLYYTSNTLVIQ